MNWVLIITLLILVGYAIKGHHDGFIKTVFSIFSVIVAIVITIIIAPIVSKELQKNDSIMKTLTKQVAKTISIDEKNISKIDAIEIIEKLVLPKSIKEGLIENNNPEMYQSLFVNDFSEYISSYLAVIIINATTFFGVFLIVWIALIILSYILDLISKLPVINGLNKTVGLLVGVIHGLIVIWIICIFLTAISSTPFGRMIFGYINDNEWLGIIYNNNLLLKVITDLANTLF